TSDSPVVLSGHIEGGQPPLALTIDGVAVALTGATFSYGATLPEGPHQFQLLATDALSRSSTVTRNIEIDRTPPVLTLTQPATNPATLSASPAAIGGTAGDPHLTRITVGGNDVPFFGSQFQTSVPVTVGTQTVTVEAFDSAGNFSRIDQLLVVPNLPPTVV